MRLASQGFHLVIPLLGIHATTLAAPSEAPCPLARLPACILTHQRRLPIVISTFPLPRPPPPPDRFSNVCSSTSQFFPFFSHSLLCSLCSRTLSHHHPFLLLPATHGLFDSVCISNCVIKESRQPPRSVEMAAGAICGARLMRQRGSGWVGGWVRGWGLDSQQHPVASWGSTGCLDFHSRGFFFFCRRSGRLQLRLVLLLCVRF